MRDNQISKKSFLAMAGFILKRVNVVKQCRHEIHLFVVLKQPDGLHRYILYFTK